MQFRDHEGVQGKRDAYPFDPRLLKVMPGYNVRDLDSAEERPALDSLKASIAARGVEEPLRVKLSGDDVYVIRGHRRHKAVMELIGEGVPIKTVLVIQAPATANDADLNIDIIGSNEDRKDLTPTQIAAVIKKQMEVFGWDVAQVATRLGWSAVKVGEYITILGADADVQAMVKAGEVSMTTAVKVVKKEGAKASETLKKAKAVAAKAGKNKITSKSVKAAKGEFHASPANVKALTKEVQYVARFCMDKKCKDRAIKVLDKLGLDLGDE